MGVNSAQKKASTPSRRASCWRTHYSTWAAAGCRSILDEASLKWDIGSFQTTLSRTRQRPFITHSFYTILIESRREKLEHFKRQCLTTMFNDNVQMFNNQCSTKRQRPWSICRCRYIDHWLLISDHCCFLSSAANYSRIAETTCLTCSSTCSLRSVLSGER